MEDLLSTLDAARILGLSVDRTRELARTGKLPVVAQTTAGRAYLRSDVERLRAERVTARRGLRA